MTYDWISFTTDYGLDDGFVAACVGVIARIAPTVRMLHITHRIAAQDIRRGATVLAQTVPYLPRAVHLAVVDPGVGTARRPLTLIAVNGLLVGPDNGLLMPAAEALGGIVAAYELTERAYQLAEVSATFHGRDLFAPAAAHLAAGIPPDRLGPTVDPATLVRLRAPDTTVEQGMLRSEILSIDGFGNIQLAATGADLDAAGCIHGAAVRVRVRDRSADAAIGRTFHDVHPGAMVVLVDSAGYAALAVNGGSAARELACAAGDTVAVRIGGL